MAAGPLSIKLRCASWQQLSTIYKRDLSRGTMFLKAASPPPIGTQVRIDLTLPSASVIVLSGVVEQHVTDPQRGSGVELKLAPIPAGSVWMIESALASESKRRNTPVAGVPVGGAGITAGPSGPIPSLNEPEEVVAAEQDLVKALLSEAESLKKLNPFLVLGVGYEANDGDVRAAFGELTKRYHPDLFARYESTELRAVAAEIFILIRDAYRKLSDEASRSQVLTSLGRPTAPRAVPLQNRPPPPPVKPPRAPTGQVPVLPPPPQARPFTDVAPTTRPGEGPAIPGRPGVNTPARGVPVVSGPIPTRPSSPPPPPMPKSMRESQPIPTIPSATGSQGIKPRAPTEPPVRPSNPRAESQPRAETNPPPPVQTNRSPVSNVPPVLSGEAGDNALEEMLDAGRFEEALAAYKVLAKKNPADRTYRAGIELCEGLRSLAQRDRLEAAQRFEAALEIDPSNERAARELAEMRRQATNERKGLLTRLMGKKEP